MSLHGLSGVAAAKVSKELRQRNDSCSLALSHAPDREPANLAQSRWSESGESVETFEGCKPDTHTIVAKTGRWYGLHYSVERIHCFAEMNWNVEVTDEFGAWYGSLAEPAQDDIDRVVGLLEAKGAQLPFPYSSGLVGSRHAHMRELRIQSGGEPYRVLYCFDPRRTAILLIGGNKVGYDRFYDAMIPIADALYDTYLIEIRKEKLI